jgi:hypothetical protein
MAQGVRGTRPMAACPQCGAPFWLPPSYVRRHVSFCSKACRIASNLRSGPCGQCRRVMRFTLRKPRRYCSRACADKAQRRATWPPCAACGDPDGYVPKKSRSPIRLAGAPYGVEGELCWTCYCRLRRWFKSREGAELSSTPRVPLMQREA